MKANMIDISHYQSMLSKAEFNCIKKSGVKGIIHKLTEGSEAGSHWIDSTVTHNTGVASSVGLKIHAYHYFLGISHNDSIAEAKWCLKNIGKVKGFDKAHSYIFMDFEDPSYKKFSKAQCTDFAKAFCDTIHNAGYHVALYSYVGFMSAHVDVGATGYPFAWKAGYPAHPDVNHPSVGKCDIWQFASDYKIKGIAGRLDADYAYQSKYIDFSKSSAVVAPAKKASNPKSTSNVTWSTRKVTANALNVRAGRGTNHSRVLVLYKGNTVKYQNGSTKDGWGYISYTNSKGKTFKGYVNMKYISGSSVSSSTYSTEYVTANALNVRAGRGTKYPVLLVLYKGNLVKYKNGSANDGWGYIKYTNSKHKTFSGYVNTHYISSKKPVSYKTITVHSGDTLWEIAKEHGTTVAHLKSVNNLHSDLIYPNQKLRY